jgi:16S rRNA (uracil1498-N3)-methyltransferase
MTRSDSPAKVRLYLDQPLGAGQEVALSEGQAHYLGNVMRLGPGAALGLFNGREGEWRAELTAISRKGAKAACLVQTAPLRAPADLWLLFAPIKKARTDFIVEKAVELGVARICPVQTDFTNSERIRQDRLHAHAIEAAEQCGATHVPEVADLQPLARVLAAWDKGRALLWADEGQAAHAAPPPPLPPAPAAILIGPEGGFSPAERARLGALACVTPLRLGPRILRADTAAVAALALWQAARGDWQ